MRRIMYWCIDALPFQDRSRRAIDETLADWTYDQELASTASQRLLARVRGALSLGRVVSWSLARETRDLAWSHGLARRGLTVAVMVVLLALLTALPMLNATNASNAFALVSLNLPLTLLASTPPTILLVLAWRPRARAVPTLGTACLLSLFTLGLSAWLVPLTTGLANEILLSSDALIVHDSIPQTHLSSVQIILAVSGWVSLTTASTILASSLARRSPLESRWWLLSIPTIYLALIPFFSFTIGSSFLVVGDDAQHGFAPGIAAWTTSTVMTIGAIVYMRRTRGTSSHEPTATSPGT